MNSLFNVAVEIGKEAWEGMKLGVKAGAIGFCLAAGFSLGKWLDVGLPMDSSTFSAIATVGGAGAFAAELFRRQPQQP